jgi:nicotinamide-nucleotide amidase
MEVRKRLGNFILGEDDKTLEGVVLDALAARGATHALAVLIEVDDGPDRINFGGSIHLAIAGPERVESRRSRIYGGRDWVRLGAVELGLDCLRRYLKGLPVTERTDFERV